MHSVQEGAASKSYGLAVAALAGVPKQVIQLAKQKLTQLEQLSQQTAQLDANPQQDLLFSANLQNFELISPLVEPSKVEQALSEIDPDELTPKQALEALYRLKGLAQ